MPAMTFEKLAGALPSQAVQVTSRPDRPSLFTRFVEAMAESRFRQAEREINICLDMLDQNRDAA